MTDPEGPAFPRATPLDNEKDSRGLTKREYFAAMALMGLATTAPNIPRELASSANAMLTKAAIEMADALIAELNKGKVK